MQGGCWCPFVRFMKGQVTPRGSRHPGKPPGLIWPQESWGLRSALPVLPAQALPCPRSFRHQLPPTHRNRGGHRSRGLPHQRSPCPALLAAAVALWSCRGPRGTAPGCDSAYCTCHRVPLKHGSVTSLYATSSKTHNHIHPGNSVISGSPPPPFFLSSDGVKSGEVVNMPGISVSPFFSQGVPCKYVQWPRGSGDVSSAFSCADLYNDLFKGTWIK